jgi:hypothetical protein
VGPPPGTLSWPAGFYIGPEAGLTFLDTLRNATDAAKAGPDLGKAAVSFEDFAAGFNAGGRAGYQWGPWRFEAEINYRHNALRIAADRFRAICAGLPDR